MPRNRKQQEFVPRQIIGFINSTTQPEQFLGLPEYAASQKSPLLNLPTLPQLKGLNASYIMYSTQGRNKKKLSKPLEA